MTSTLEQRIAIRSTDRDNAVLPATMRAIVQDRYGSTDVLHPDNVPLPPIGNDEVLIRVHAAGVDRGTLHLLEGKPYLMRVMGFGLRGPKNPTPGLDVAGVVARVGSAVTTFHAGDEVFGIARGSFAEFAAARADKLAHKPQNLTFTEAAVVPVSGLTALQAVVDVGRVERDQRVLIIGASGGVGTFAVQIAKARGAIVTAVCSSEKAELVRSLGADFVLDYRKDNFADGKHRYDLIVDIGGNSRLRRLRKALTPDGTLVIVGGEAGGNVTGGFGRSIRAALLSPFVRQRLAMLVNKERGDYLERLSTYIEAGEVSPAVDRVFPLEQAADAIRTVGEGRARGKIAIEVRTPAPHGTVA
jgi:NADPH:quinone reductase-like Zn-dependent oxidoreductase